MIPTTSPLVTLLLTKKSISSLKMVKNILFHFSRFLALANMYLEITMNSFFWRIMFGGGDSRNFHEGASK